MDPFRYNSIAAWWHTCDPWLVDSCGRLGFVLARPMAFYKKSANPFYALLVVTGIVFVVTACAYGVMSLTEVRNGQLAHAEVPPEGHPLNEWLKRHGDTALLSELGFLAVFTFGAIATDDLWQRRARAKGKKQQRLPLSNEHFAVQYIEEPQRYRGGEPPSRKDD